jgi:hypothetical protein
VWIRLSTGSLCIDLTPPEENRLALIYLAEDRRPAGTSLCKPPEEWEIITSTSLHDYHEICYWHLRRWKHWSVSSNVSVKLGSIRHWSGPEYESSLEVASSDCRIIDRGWATMDPIVDNYWHPYVPS